MGEAIMSGQRQFEPSAPCHGVDGHDHRFGRGYVQVDQIAPLADTCWVAIEIGDVGAAAEHLARARDHNRRAREIGVGCGHFPGQRGDEAGTNGQSIDRRIGQTQQDVRAIAVDFYCYVAKSWIRMRRQEATEWRLRQPQCRPPKRWPAGASARRRTPPRHAWRCVPHRRLMRPRPCASTSSQG